MKDTQYNENYIDDVHYDQSYQIEVEDFVSNWKITHKHYDQNQNYQEVRDGIILICHINYRLAVVEQLEDQLDLDYKECVIDYSVLFDLSV